MRTRNRAEECLLELSVVTSPTCDVDEPSSNARDEQLVVDLELDNMVELFFSISEHAIQLLGLRDSSGETVKNEPEQPSTQCSM